MKARAVSTFISESRRWDKDRSPLLLLWAEAEGEDKLDAALVGALRRPRGMGENGGYKLADTGRRRREGIWILVDLEWQRVAKGAKPVAENRL